VGMKSRALGAGQVRSGQVRSGGGLGVGGCSMLNVMKGIPIVHQAFVTSYSMYI